MERFRREVIHREISRVLCPPTLWQPRGAKNTAQEKCCLTTPSFLSTGTRGKTSKEAAPPAPSSNQPVEHESFGGPRKVPPRQATYVFAIPLRQLSTTPRAVLDSNVSDQCQRALIIIWLRSFWLQGTVLQNKKNRLGTVVNKDAIPATPGALRAALEARATPY